jgi:hypothetical protein
MPRNSAARRSSLVQVLRQQSPGEVEHARQHSISRSRPPLYAQPRLQITHTPVMPRANDKRYYSQRPRPLV